MLLKYRLLYCKEGVSKVTGTPSFYVLCTMFRDNVAISGCYAQIAIYSPDRRYMKPVGLA